MNKVKKLFSIFLCALFLLNISTVFGELTRDELQGGLYDAATEGNKRKVKAFLKKGADINDDDDDDYLSITPLTAAVWENNKDMVEFLLRNGADIKKGCLDCQNMIEFAISECKFRVIPALLRGAGKRLAKKIRRKNGWTDLHLSAMENDTEKTQELLDAGRKIDTGDKNGNSALFWAANGLHIETMRVLLNRGANVNHKNKSGATPLFVVVLYSSSDEVITSSEWSAWLALSYSDKKKRDREQIRSLMVCELLLKYGADLRIKNNRGLTVLDLYQEPLLWCRLNRAIRKVLVSKLPFLSRVTSRVHDIEYYFNKRRVADL